MTTELLRPENISKVYGNGDAEVHALDGVNLTVNEGDLVAVVGPSGSGKSTLMNIIGCLDIPTSGRYWFAGEDVSRMGEAPLAHIRNRRIGFVFQEFHLLSDLSAWRNVELPLLYRSAHHRHGMALHVLDQVGLGTRVDFLPNQLSGGQQQRVAIARALVTDPDLVLADEPTGNLDSASSRDILAILQQLNDAGRIVILITHDASVASIARRVARTVDGRLTEENVGGAGHSRPADIAGVSPVG